MSYKYFTNTDGTYRNNRLRMVRDSVATGNYSVDIDDQLPRVSNAADSNYVYDAIGNLIQDKSENITNIQWTVYGKIQKITKTAVNTGDVSAISYWYDAAGNRVGKKVEALNRKPQYSWYTRDASGNVMGVYQYEGNTLTDDTLRLREHHLYGSSRIGVWNRWINMDLPVSTGTTINLLGKSYDGTFERGNKFFELSNHLGNVLATVSDKKFGHNGGSGVVDYYEADVVTASDYYPFGMLMPGRQFGQGENFPGVLVNGTTTVNGYSLPIDLNLTSRGAGDAAEYVASNSVEFDGEFESSSTDEFSAYIADNTYAGTGNQVSGGGAYGTAGRYRYGFNGKENDNEVKGIGNQQDYGMRIYDPRIGKFLSVDPLNQSYPWYSPYQYAGNNPIWNIDIDGLEPLPTQNNLQKTREILNDAMGGWFFKNGNLLRASNASTNARPTVWWQHAHGFANNVGNRTFNKLKGVAGEAIAADIALNNFQKHIGTMRILNDQFQAFNDSENGFEFGLGGTWDYGIKVQYNSFNSTRDNEVPIFNMMLFSANGTPGKVYNFDLKTPKRFLFEIKTLSPDASPSSLFLNIKKGLNQAIDNAALNPDSYSILMVDKQAYLKMWNSASSAERTEIQNLYNNLDKRNGALWLIDELEPRAKKLANDAYKDVKNGTSDENK